MQEQTAPANIRVIFSLTLIHFIGDFYNAFVNPLLPVFTERFALSMAQVGFIVGISRFLAFVVQPTVGYFADSYHTRFFPLGGPLLGIVFISLSGIAPNYATLILFLGLGSIGSSMFHPTTAGMISSFSGRHFGISMAVFVQGGTLAFGTGPLFITYYVSRFGLESMPYIMIFGLLVMVYLFFTVPTPQGEGLNGFGFIGSLKEVFGKVWKPILLLWIIMVFRTFVAQSFLAFLPIHYSNEGYSLTMVGFVISLFIVSGAFSGLIAGHFSDRFGYRPVLLTSFALSTPCLILMLVLPGNWIILGAFMCGFFILASIPLGVALAQRMAPRGKAMASSLMMGLAQGVGGMLTPVSGKFADLYSIPAVLSVIAFIPLLALGLIWFMRENENQTAR